MPKQSGALRKREHLKHGQLMPHEHAARWLDEFSPGGWMRRRGWPAMGELMTSIEQAMPKVDIIDSDDEILVRAQLPGVDKENLDVSVTENTVTIEGSRHYEEEEEIGEYYCCEIMRGSFSRTLDLPDSVDTEKARANFENGILKISMPKLEKSKRRHITL